MDLHRERRTDFVDYYFGQLSAQEQEKTRVAAAEYAYERMTTRENRVNEFYIDEETHFTPETLAKIKNIQAIICAYRYDESNGMVDYFDTNFYYNIYTKPAAVKPTTPDDEPTKPTKDEPKEEPAAEETAPVHPAEQAQESAKDPRYQVIVNDDRYGGLDEKLDYSRITDARKAMHNYVNKEDWESAAIYDRKSGEIVETYGEYFPVDQINVRAKAQDHESVVEAAEIHTPSARYQVVMSQCFSADHEEDIITAGVCYDNLPEARCTAIGVVGEYDASAIFDGKTGKIIEITSGFPYWRIYSTGSAPAEEPATICRIDENGHDIIVKFVDDDCYTVEYCEDGKRLGEVEENCTAEYIDFRYGIIVNPEHNIQNQPTPAETITESAGEIPEEVPETAGFHPIINNLPKKSKWDVWNVHPEEYLSSCVVPLVRCDENYHVLDTVYLKVGTPEEVKTLMSAAAVGNRRRWPKYSKQYRRETVQRAADIIEKYYI